MSRAYKALPATEQLWEQFDYKPLTGELVRKKGKPIATHCVQGYKRVHINGLTYPQHRIVWGWVTGKEPGQNPLDHIDRNKANNCFWNLRVCNDSVNMLNRQCKNYYYCNTHKTWVVKLVVEGTAIRRWASSENAAQEMARQLKSGYVG